MKSNPKAIFSGPALLFLLSLCGLPLIVNPVISLNFNDVFLNIKVVWILAVVLPAAAYLTYQNRSRVDQRIVWVSMFLFGWMALSGLITGRGWLNFTGAPDRLQGFPIYLTYGLIALAAYLWSRREAKSGEQFVRVLSWLTVPLGIYVALQYYGVVGILDGGASSGVAATAAGATLGNRGYLAGCMALLLPLAATFATRSRWGLLCVFLAGFSLTASFTRGALLAVLVGYCLWLIQGNSRQYLVHGALLLGLLAPLPHLTEGQVSLRDFGTGTGQQRLNDDGARSPLWNTALYGIRLKPLFGWGAGQLFNVMVQRPNRQVLTEFGVQVAGRNVSRLPRADGQAPSWRIEGGTEKPTIVTQPVNAIHNEYMEYAFTFGIPAALAFCALYLTGFLRAWKRLPWAAASLATYLVYLLTWPETVRFAPLAWAILGFALAASFGALPSSRHPFPTTQLPPFKEDPS
jgi:O-antigen ligase